MVTQELKKAILDGIAIVQESENIKLRFSDDSQQKLQTKESEIQQLRDFTNAKVTELKRRLEHVENLWSASGIPYVEQSELTIDIATEEGFLTSFYVEFTQELEKFVEIKKSNSLPKGS